MSVPAGSDRTLVRAARPPYLLAFAAAATALVAGGLTWWDPDLLRGPDVMNGSARGTAMVVVLVAVPVLLIGVRSVAHGGLRGGFLWVGALAYLTYNSVLFLFATPYNRAFLLYVVMLSTAVWALVSVLVLSDAGLVAEQTSRTLPRRLVAGYVWVVVALNALAWLRGVAPALVGDPPGQLVEGTGVQTNALYVQDLAFWLPIAAVTAWWLWGRRPWGVWLTGSLLVFWTIEAIGVAVDQWLGHRADPLSDLASPGASVGFAVLALVTASLGWLYISKVGSQASSAGNSRGGSPE